MKRHIIDNLTGLGYHQIFGRLTLCGRYLEPKNLVLAHQANCLSCQKKFEKLVEFYSQLDADDKLPDIDSRIAAHLIK